MGCRVLAAVLIAGCSFHPPPSSIDPTDAAAPGKLDASSSELPDGAVAGSDAANPDAVITQSTTDHVSVADVWLHSGQPNTSFVNDPYVIADGVPNATALLRFDLGALSGTQIVSAELHIWTDFDPGATVEVSTMLENWAETSATWNQRSSGVAWSTTGANPPGSRSATPIGSFTPGPAFTEFSVALTPAAIAGWVANPATNFGLAIFSANVDGPRFVSREGSAANRPFLRITHLP